METFISFTLILIIVLDPIGLALILPSLLKNVPVKNRSWIIFREMCFALFALLLFFFLGNAIVGWLQIDSATLGISGALVLFLIALGMVFPVISIVTASTRPGQQETAPAEPFIVPIAIPLYAGPSGLSIVMIHGAKFMTEPEQSYPFMLALIAAWLVSLVVVLFSQKILCLLGSRGALALERLVGILLILISIQMFVDSVIAGIGEFEARAELAKENYIEAVHQQEAAGTAESAGTPRRQAPTHPIFTGKQN